jgi:hypothetical protein
MIIQVEINDHDIVFFIVLSMDVFIQQLESARCDVVWESDALHIWLQLVHRILAIYHNSKDVRAYVTRQHEQVAG